MLTRLLIANRGEIARRIIRTARAAGLQTVAVHADPDRDAAHVHDADLAVALPGTAAADTYLCIPALLDAAARSGADAVHPGYGFLAERADFARAVIDAGLTWVGPSPEAIASMGDKIAAKQLMADAGVPVLPSTTDVGEADAVGWPLIVKAAAGGGGKGMRVVRDPAGLDDAVAAARREAAAAFGDDRVFLERYLDRPRHVEVQVLADAHGTVVHLGERECSVQRRHQKVIEEAPSPVVSPADRARLGEAAVAAARAIGYVGAGTVEFVATTPDGGGDLEFAFLEVNTRLQVEHPVTEEAWRIGADPAPIDLVALQLHVAGGGPLPFAQPDLRLVRHSVEARLYAEDPARGFLPAAGPVELLDPAGLPGTRWEAGVRTGDAVTPHYDPMIAKVIATASTRTAAVRLLATELTTTRLHGVTTNRDALVALLRHPAFLAGDIDTGLIDRIDVAELAPPTPPAALLTHAVAVVLAADRLAAEGARVQRTVPRGWRNNAALPTTTRLRHAAPGQAGSGAEVVVDLGAATAAAGPRPLRVDGEQVDVVAHAIERAGDDVAVDLAVDGLRTRVRVRPLAGWGSAGPAVRDDRAEVVWAADSALGGTRLVELPRFPEAVAEEAPGSLLAPMPGRVLEVAVAEGDRVARGDLLLVLEAMKMEHRVTAPHDGAVEALHVDAGAQVDAGAVLAVIPQDDADHAPGEGA